MVMAEWAQIFVSEYEYLEVNKESHILKVHYIFMENY